ncbi:unannotated protein [freshwater metagenome]|uniref:Unannotated protein n=1 Tax=freshwater metagenome TaxID=449393 RepID=A0A6J7IJE6_9ZZZZ
MVAGVDEDNFDCRIDLGGEVDEHSVGHRRRYRKVGRKGFDAPTDDLFRGPRFEVIAEFRKFFVAEFGC